MPTGDAQLPPRRPLEERAAATLRGATLQVGTALFLAALALALALYYPTLGSSWAYDDVDYINQAADALSGNTPFWRIVFRPQGEHVVAGFRLALFASLRSFGLDAFPWRLLVLFAHAATAALLGLLAWRECGRRGAAMATSLVYVGACGLSSMWIWFPSGASVPFAMVGISAATVLLAARRRLGVLPARLGAAAALLAALLFETTLVPLVALPIVVDERERRRAGASRWSIGPFTTGVLAAGAAAAALAMLAFKRTFGPSPSLDLLAGLPRAAFLLVSAGFRALFPGIQILASEPGLRTALLGGLLGTVVIAGVGALLLGLWRQGRPPLADLAALALVGPLGWLVLVGIGRWRTSYWELYLADRYYFPLLVPLALLAGAVTASLGARLASWPRRPRLVLAALVLAALLAELALHRRAAIGRIPFDVYAAHQQRFEQLALLASRLEEAALALPPAGPPLAVPDTDLWLPDVHNGRVSTRVLTHVLADGAGDRLVLSREPLGERDSRILDGVLAEWAEEIGEPLPYLSMVDGRLVNAHLVTRADFRAASFDHLVSGGFSPWEGTHRWMGADGELRIALVCTRLSFLLDVPAEALATLPGRVLPLHVRVVDEAVPVEAELGTLQLGAGTRQYALEATPFLQRIGAGRRVRLVFRAEHTWRPIDVLPGSTDTRELSAMFLTAGCE